MSDQPNREPATEADLPELHGVVPIVVTPYDRHGHVDEDSLRRLVEYNIRAGVHGLGIALGSEIFKLTDAERELVVSTVIDQARGRVPVMMNTGASTPEAAMRHSKNAERAGVSVVICTSPGGETSDEEKLEYYRAISTAVDVPVIVQDTADNHVSAELLRTLAATLPTVRYAKVESVPPARRVYEAVQACGPTMGIFGGAGGSALLQELRRGSIGTMPWPSTPHAFVEVWDLWRAGKVAEAGATFDRKILPVLRVAAGGLAIGQLVHKELLRRLGVIEHASVRDADEQPDPMTWEEIAEAAEILAEQTATTDTGGKSS